MTEIAISRWIRKDRTSPTSHNYTWGTVIKCYSPHHTWTLEMKMTDDMKMAGGLKLDGLQGSFQLNPLYVSLSFHCQSLRCGQNWEWPNEINWKKKSKQVWSWYERQKVASAFKLHCEKAGGIQSPTLDALDLTVS